jgi:hypothetical protein
MALMGQKRRASREEQREGGQRETRHVVRRVPARRWSGEHRQQRRKESRSRS